MRLSDTLDLARLEGLRGEAWGSTIKRRWFEPPDQQFVELQNGAVYVTRLSVDGPMAWERERERM